MSQYPSLNFSYADTDADCEDISFKIEQEPWQTTGIVTREHVAAYLMKVLYDVGDYPVTCGVNDIDGLLSYDSVVHVYPSRNDIHYIFGLSHGTARTAIHATVTLTESVSFDIDKNLDVTYPIHSVKKIKWVGNVFDENGNIIFNPPQFVVSQNSVTLPYMIYGAAEVTYVTERHSYNINVPKRSGSIENSYQSFAYVVSKCGVSYIELEGLPLGDGECEEDTPENVEIDPDDKKPYSPQANKIEEIDYCTRELK